MIVVGEDFSFKPATLEFCKQYAKNMGIPLEKIYIDHGPKHGPFDTLINNINPFGTGSYGSFAIPWVIVLEGESMEYIYTSMEDFTFLAILEALSEALNN